MDVGGSTDTSTTGTNLLPTQLPLPQGSILRGAVSSDGGLRVLISFSPLLPVADRGPMHRLTSLKPEGSWCGCQPADNAWHASTLHTG